MREACTIDVVLFDFGGVIAEEGFKEGLRVIAKANGLDEESFIEAGHEAVYGSGYVLGRGTEAAFWETLKKETRIEGENADLKLEILSRFIIRKWVLDIVDRLRARGIRTGILSDQTDWLDRLNDEHGFFKFFDVVFNSYHLGDGKRNPEFFDVIARRLGVPGDRILFIDDSPGNCARARQKGWHAIEYVNRADFMEALEEYCPSIATGSPTAAGAHE